VLQSTVNRAEDLLKNKPFTVHPGNGKIFLFRGRPRVLLCATEHYGSVLNREFDFERYLADAAEKEQTLTRTFLLYREFQTPLNPYSPCKPESTDWVTPFARVGAGTATDGLPKFDLSRWDDEFFERLHRFLSLTSEYGIVVELVLFSNSYRPDIWAVNPLNAVNNVNDVEACEWFEYTSRKHTKLFAWQLAYVRKMVQETNRYDHVFYEICNEPGGGWQALASPTRDDVNAWQMAVGRVIRETEAALPNRHLIAGMVAYDYAATEQCMDEAFREFDVDIVNLHPSPAVRASGKSFDLGAFMVRQLRLRGMRDYFLATHAEPKPLSLDEDGAASRWLDPDGWTIHRKRAWTTLFCQAHYDCIDFSILIRSETGTLESQRCIRAWMKHLSRYIHGIDLVRARPLPGFLQQRPPHTVESVLAVAGESYHVYLADEREWNEPGAGEPIAGAIEFDLPPGDYRVSCFSPVTGEGSPLLPLRGGPRVRIVLPSFTHDLVVCIRR
jgi:hypothetical protein